MTDVRRVADLVREHRFWSLRGDCTCGADCSDPAGPDAADHLAAVLAAELAVRFPNTR